MTSKHDEDGDASAGLLMAMKCEKKVKRKNWCKDWLKKRNGYTQMKLLKGLILNPSNCDNYWQNILRIGVYLSIYF